MNKSWVAMFCTEWPVHFSFSGTFPATGRKKALAQKILPEWGEGSDQMISLRVPVWDTEGKLVVDRRSWREAEKILRDHYKPSGDQSNEKQKLWGTEEMRRELEAAADEGGETKNGENPGEVSVNCNWRMASDITQFLGLSWFLNVYLI